MMMKFFRQFLSITVSLVLFSCSSPDNSGSDNGETDVPGKTDPEVAEGYARFYVSVADESPRRTIGLVPSNFGKYKVKVNGTSYSVSVDDSGRSYVDVPEASDGDYSAVLFTAKSFLEHGSSPYNDIKLPYSQFYKTTALSLVDFPQYASLGKADGNEFKFNDGFALLDLTLKGSSSVSSVKVTNPAGSPIAGTALFLPSKKQFQMSDGIACAVLNCSDQGNYAPLGAEGTRFYIVIAPGTYSSGLDLTVCDSGHKMMSSSLSSLTLSGGQVKSVSLNYSPADDLIWYEGFDNCVWGGDIIGGASSKGYAPDDKKLGIGDGTDRTGYESAATAVEYDYPGSGFIQSNTWSEVSGKNVGSSHQMSESYVKSRNFQDWTYLFRCQEYQGCVAVGAGSSARGIMQTPAITNLSGISTIKLSFKLCFQAGSTDALSLNVVNGGMISSCTVAGKEDELTSENSGYTGASSSYVLAGEKVGIPSSDAASKEWRTVEVVVDRATDGTQFYFAGNDVNSGVHGIYVDDITVTKVKDMTRPANSLRVLYWNIQNGMWADQGNNYNNFVAFVKKYDPDVCVWCETCTLYATNSNVSVSASDKFLPGGWAALAARYGHAYCAQGGYRDNYPQEITSKHKITTIAKITDSDVSGKPVSHGAAVQEITVNGKSIYFVTLHLWPQSYGYGVASADREASSAAFEGDYYRQFEMNYIIKKTVNNPEYASQKDWLMMGDFNSRSRLDDWFYGGLSDVTYLAQDEILNNTDLKDVIAFRYPGMFLSSTAGNSRIDYLYASPSMNGSVGNAMILVDKWTSISKSAYSSNFYDPSDHRPILVDFNL